MRTGVAAAAVSVGQFTFESNTDEALHCFSEVHITQCCTATFTGAMTFFKFVCAVMTRSLFILVSLIGVWRVAWVKKDPMYWLLTVLYLPLVIEMIVTLKRRKGKDYKW